MRSNLTTDIINNVTCTTGGTPQAAARHHLRRLFGGDDGSDGYVDDPLGSDGSSAGVDIRRMLATAGTCPANGAGSLSLLVLLSVPAAAANDSQLYKTQIASALDAWTAESAAGSGAASMLQLCGPSIDAIVTTTTVSSRRCGELLDALLWERRALRCCVRLTWYICFCPVAGARGD